MAILTQADFVSGKYQLHQITADDKDAEIKESIERVQNEILDKLLGVELKDLFDIEYVDPIPTKWSELIDGVVYDNTNLNIKVRFVGIKEALKAFTYADYLKKETINTDAGQERLMPKSTTKKVNRMELQTLRKQSFNDGVQIYQMARDYMYQNKDNYPNWKYSQISFK